MYQRIEGKHVNAILEYPEYPGIIIFHCNHNEISNFRPSVLTLTAIYNLYTPGPVCSIYFEVEAGQVCFKELAAQTEKEQAPEKNGSLQQSGPEKNVPYSIHLVPSIFLATVIKYPHKHFYRKYNDSADKYSEF